MVGIEMRSTRMLLWFKLVRKQSVVDGSIVSLRATLETCLLLEI
jgi:hypothetical protein